MPKGNRLSKMSIEFVSLVDRGAGTGADMVIAKRDDTNPTHPPSTLRVDKEDVMPKTQETDLSKMAPEDLLEYARQAEAALVKKNDEVAEKDRQIAALAEVVDSFDSDDTEVDFSDDASVEKFLKSLDDEDATIVGALLKRARDAEADAQEATTIAKAEREIRLIKRFEDEAKGLSSLPGVTADETAKMLKRLFETDEDTYESVHGILTSVAKAYKDADIFGEVGTTGPAIANDLDSFAKSLREKDPELTEAGSIAKALEMRPDLYTQES